jgi:hypothetical protein
MESGARTLPPVVEARLGMVSGMDHEPIEIRECQSMREIQAIGVLSGRLGTHQELWSLKDRQRGHASLVRSLSEGGWTWLSERFVYVSTP